MKEKQCIDREEHDTIPICINIPRHSFFVDLVIISGINSYH